MSTKLLSNRRYYTFGKACRIFFMLMMHYKVINKHLLKNLPTDGYGGPNLIIAPQHFTNWDPFFIGSVLNFRLRFFAKESLLKVPVFGKILHNLGTIPIDRSFKDRAKSMEQMDYVVNLLIEGESVMVFPGGTRNAQTVKPGIGHIALASKKSILPISISYPPHWGPFYFGFTKITIHEVIDPQKLPFSKLDRKKLAQEIWEAINK